PRRLFDQPAGPRVEVQEVGVVNDRSPLVGRTSTFDLVDLAAPIIDEVVVALHEAFHAKIAFRPRAHDTPNFVGRAFCKRRGRVSTSRMLGQALSEVSRSPSSSRNSFARSRRQGHDLLLLAGLSGRGLSAGTLDLVRAAEAEVPAASLRRNHPASEGTRTGARW